MPTKSPRKFELATVMGPAPRKMPKAELSSKNELAIWTEPALVRLISSPLRPPALWAKAPPLLLNDEPMILATTARTKRPPSVLGLLSKLELATSRWVAAVVPSAIRPMLRLADALDARTVPVVPLSKMMPRPYCGCWPVSAAVPLLLAVTLVRLSVVLLLA